MDIGRWARNGIVATGLVGLGVMGGCPSLESPTSYSPEQMPGAIEGTWVRSDGVSFVFDEQGRLESYGNGLYQSGRQQFFVDPLYGSGVLVDFTGRVNFRENGFSTVLDRSFQQEDYSIVSQAIVDGQLDRANHLSLKFDYVGAGDFFGASLGDGTYDLVRP